MYTTNPGGSLMIWERTRNKLACNRSVGEVDERGEVAHVGGEGPAAADDLVQDSKRLTGPSQASVASIPPDTRVPCSSWR
jgi:hypothetical protein